MGNLGVGKKTLAKAWDAVRSPVAIQFRLAERLPLPPKDRPRIDFIVLMLDLTSRASWEVLQTSLTAIDPLYLHGRCCVVATRIDRPHDASVTNLELDSLLEDAGIPPFYVDMSSDSGSRVLVDRLNVAVKTAAGHADLTPSVLSTMVYGLVPE